MKKFVRRLAWMEAVLILLASAVSCSEDGENLDTESTSPVLSEETSTHEEATLDERLVPGLEIRNLDGTTFRIFGPKDTGEDWQLHDMAAEEMNGEVLNDEIYKRNDFLTETYDFNIELPDPAGASLASLITAGDTTYNAHAINAAGSVPLAADGMLLNLKSLPYIDLTQPYWSQTLTSPLSIAGRTYMATGDITVVPKEGVRAFYFNKDLLKDYHLDSPYELVREGRWTVDTMFSMMEAATTDLDGNGVMDKHDRYGFIGQTFMGIVLYQGSGESFASKDENDLYTITVENERSVSALIDITALMAQEKNNIYMTDDWQWLLSMFENDQGLFYTEVMRHIETMRGYDVVFGIIPTPKYDEAQENYSHYLDRGCNLFYSLPITAIDPDTDAYILEVIAAASRHYVTPAYYDVCLKSKYTRDEESSEMLDIIFSTYHLELAEVYGWGNMVSALNDCMNNNGNVSSRLKALHKVTAKHLKKTIESYQDNDTWNQ